MSNIHTFPDGSSIDLDQLSAWGYAILQIHHGQDGNTVRILGDGSPTAGPVEEPDSPTLVEHGPLTDWFGSVGGLSPGQESAWSHGIFPANEEFVLFFDVNVPANKTWEVRLTDGQGNARATAQFYRPNGSAAGDPGSLSSGAANRARRTFKPDHKGRWAVGVTSKDEQKIFGVLEVIER